MDLKRLFGALLVLLLARPVVAQDASAVASLTSTTCPGSGCVSLAITGRGGGVVTITGSFTGTAQFEFFDGTTWFAMPVATISTTPSIVTSSTGTGQWTFGASGIAGFRVRMSAYSNGTVVVRIRVSAASSTSLARLGAASNADRFVVTQAASDVPNATVTGTGVATFLATPSSANLATALADTLAIGSSPKVLLSSAFVSSTWTSTLTNVTNVDGSTFINGFYLQVGDRVLGTMLLTIDATSSGASTEVDASVPVASNFAAAGDSLGNCTSVGTTESFGIISDTSNHRLRILGVASSAANQTLVCSFFYRVI